MNITYLGTGSWGFCLAYLLASKGFHVTSWTTNKELAKTIQQKKIHPRFPDIHCPETLSITTDLEKALSNAEFIVESVTAAGLRPVCEQVKKIALPSCPFVITSKGIEQNSALILPEVAKEVFGDDSQIGAISGPGYAKEVIHQLPTSVVASAYDPTIMNLICETFTTPTFRVYPNSDLLGVSLGGALKNIIAIACGISDGLHFGCSARASLMTRGLHEIQKLASAMGCKKETLSGLAGMGDVTLTCSSPMSRNFSFGQLLAKGLSIEEAKIQVGMVVEGAYTCVSALKLSNTYQISMPITEYVYKIIYEGLKPAEAVKLLMQRTIKEEHL